MFLPLLAIPLSRCDDSIDDCIRIWWQVVVVVVVVVVVLVEAAGKSRLDGPLSPGSVSWKDNIDATDRKDASSPDG